MVATSDREVFVTTLRRWRNVTQEQIDLYSNGTTYIAFGGKDITQQTIDQLKAECAHLDKLISEWLQPAS